MRVFLLVLAAAVLAALPARATDLTVVVRDARGAPAADAVVMLEPAAAQAARRAAAAPLQLSQHDLQFDPFVLVVPVGSEVAFPNRDKVRHHVYSFSTPKRFELKLYSRDESRTVRFDKPGVVAIGCNIHDTMSAFIRVVDTPWAAKTDAAGRVVLRGAPGGPATLRVWHPYAKARDGEATSRLSLPAAGALERSVALDLRRPPLRSHDY